MKIVTRNYFLEKGIAAIVAELASQMNYLPLFIDISDPGPFPTVDITRHQVLFYITQKAPGPGEEHLLHTRIHEGIFISLPMTVAEMGRIILNGMKYGYPRRRIPREKQLTANELRVIGFLSEKGNLQSCARTLEVGMKTVSIRKRRAMKKLGIDSTQELCQFMRVLKSVAGAVRQSTFKHPFSGNDA